MNYCVWVNDGRTLSLLIYSFSQCIVLIQWQCPQFTLHGLTV